MLFMTELQVVEVEELNGVGSWYPYPTGRSIRFGFACYRTRESIRQVKQYKVTFRNIYGKKYKLYTVSYHKEQHPDQTVFEFPANGIFGTTTINYVPNIGEIY